MLDSQQSILDDLSVSLDMKLKDWAHPNVSAKVLWKQDLEKSIKALNKADWDKRRRREITDIYIPIKEVKYSTYFRKFIHFTSLTNS